MPTTHFAAAAAVAAMPWCYAAPCAESAVPPFAAPAEREQFQRPWNALEHGEQSLEFRGYYCYGWTSGGDAMPSFGAPGAAAKYPLGNEEVQSVDDGYVAETNAVGGPALPSFNRVSPAGSFTYPEYAQVGMTERKARSTHDVVTTTVPFDTTVRAIIEGRTFGFCKLITDRTSRLILGCHVVGERAIEVTQLAAVAMAAGMRVDELARVAVSFPTYAEVLVQAAVRAAVELELPLGSEGERVRLATAAADSAFAQEESVHVVGR